MTERFGLVGETKYSSYHFKREETFSNHVMRHFKKIFGKASVYLNLKRKLMPTSGRGTIPDGYVITLAKPYRWFLIEYELLNSYPISAAKHSHISSQLQKFVTSLANPSSRNTVLAEAYAEVNRNDKLKKRIVNATGDDVYGFLTQVFSKDPTIAIIIEQADADRQVGNICSAYKCNAIVIRFETYVKNASRSHFHVFNTTCESKPGKTVWANGRARGGITHQGCYRLPILEALVKLGGTGKCRSVFEEIHGKMRPVLKSKDYEKIACDEMRWVSLTRWEARKLKEEGLVKISAPLGTWEITATGKQYYDSLIAQNTCSPPV